MPAAIGPLACRLQPGAGLNALPIAAGMVLFHESLPSGWVGAVRVTAFAAVVAGAVLLGARGKAAEPEPHAAT